MIRLRGLAWFVGCASVACVASLAAGAYAREHVAMNHWFWLISPVLYIKHVQNLNTAVPLVPIMILAAGSLPLLLWALRSSHPEAPSLLDGCAGLIVGGGLANYAEIVTLGSVTDFLGVRTAGIYSMGDVAQLVGYSLFPIAIVQVAAMRYHSLIRLAIGAGFYAGVVWLAFRDPQNLLLMYVATAAAAPAAAVMMHRQLRSPTRSIGRRVRIHFLQLDLLRARLVHNPVSAVEDLVNLGHLEVVCSALESAEVSFIEARQIATEHGYELGVACAGVGLADVGGDLVVGEVVASASQLTVNELPSAARFVGDAPAVELADALTSPKKRRARGTS